MIERIWLVQPLAFARCGGSSTPLQNYDWAPADLSPQGSGRTRVVARPGLAVTDDGSVVAVPPPPDGRIVFRDAEGIRPACPFFELHGSWDGGAGPVSAAVLQAHGLSLEDVVWRVRHANHKAFHLTHAEGDKIESSAEIAGNDHGLKQLEGRAPPGAAEPLVPNGRFIPQGRVQVLRPTEELPTLRFRFYAPPGHAYAPTNFFDRLVAEPDPVADPGAFALAQALGRLFGRDWDSFDIAKDRLILNPKAAWPNYGLLRFDELPGQLFGLLPELGDAAALRSAADQSELLRIVAGPAGDVGNLPPGLFAYTVGPHAVQSSVGMVDDLGDGLITCEIGELRAHARIAVGPPHFAPDRRQPVSLADGLADRLLRDEVRDPAWIADGEAWEATRASVRDLLDRAYETAGLANIDVWNAWFLEQNRANAADPDSTTTPDEAARMLWETPDVPTVEELPLTTLGHRRHRRNVATEFFDDIARDNPDLIERWIRTPGEPKRLYDRRMPAVMRGADRHPFTITRRQYDEMAAWAKRLRDEALGAQRAADDGGDGQAPPGRRRR